MTYLRAGRLARGATILVVATSVALVTSCSSLGIGGKPATNLRFTDVALQAGVQDRENMGRAVGAGDFNGDGWIDFYFGNPGGQSRIFLSNGPGPDGTITFRPAQTLLEGPETFAFGAALGDYDNDGVADLFVASGGADGALAQVQTWDHLFHGNGDGTFTEVTEQAGVKGHHNPEGKLVPTDSSQGAWGDYDRDGYLDLYVSNQYDNGNTLFHNNGDGTFTDVTAQAGLDLDTRSMAAVWVDFDNDGWPDLLVPHAKGGHHSLYHNNRNGTFTRVSSDAFNYPWNAWAAAAADFNQDGLVDAAGFAWHQVRLDGVRTRVMDLYSRILDLTHLRSRQTIDEDAEGLYINQGSMKFVDQAAASGWSPKGTRTSSSMGNQVGDLNNDGLPEIYLANGAPNYGERDRLYENVGSFGGPPQFRDVSYLVDSPAPDDPSFRLTRPIPAYVLGQKTICGAEGQSVLKEASESGARGVFGCASVPVKPGEPPYMPNTGPGMPWTAPYPYRGHAVVFVDYNKDNKVDIMAVKGGPLTMPWTIEPNRLWRNDSIDVGALLTVKLVGGLSNRDGAGARLIARPSLNGVLKEPRYVDVLDQNGFGASRWGETYIGLGRADKVASLEIDWPSGVIQVLHDLPVNQRLTINEADALAFADGFDRSIDTQRWEMKRGDWSWKERQAASCGGMLATRDGAFSATDGELVTKITVDQTGSAGAIVRLGGTGGGIAAVVSGRGLEVGPLEDLHRTPPQDIGPVEPGRMVLLRIRFRGQNVDVQADEGPPVKVQDPTPASGPVALLVEGGCARFDHVAVSR